MPRGTKKEVYNIHPGGVREDVNPITIPDGHLLSSLNWLTRRGVGRPRPGYLQVGTQMSPAERIIGIGFRGSPLAGNNTILHTTNKAWFWNGSTLDDRTGTFTTSQADDQVRMVPYVSSGTTWLTRINAANAMDKWNGTGNFQNVAAAPAGVDITAVGPYLMVARAGGDDYAVQWNSFNDIDDWPAINIARLVDTPGKVVAVRALSPLSVAVYKEDAVYLGTIQAAQTAFQFQLISQTSGPVSAAAVCAAQGSHYWLGENLAFFKFDGGTVTPFTTAISATVLTNFNVSNKGQTHSAMLDRDSSEIWFWYSGPTGLMNKAVSLNLSTQAVNDHTFTDPISASASWTKFSQLTIDGLDSFTTTINGLDAIYATIDSMSTPAQATAVLGDTVGKFYRFGPYTMDNNVAFPWNFENGYRAVGGLEARAEVDSVVSYWTARSGSSFPVTVHLTVSDTVGERDLSFSKVVNLFTDSNHLVEFRGLRGKWVKIKHSGAINLEGLEHRGAAVLCWPRAMV
jgi:hypothetical protein